MAVSVNNLEKADIAPTTLNAYLRRIDKLTSVTGNSIEWVMTNPQTTLKYILGTISNNSATIAGYISTICKLFSVNPQFKNLHRKHIEVWEKYLTHYRALEQERYKKSELSERQLKNFVDWETVSQMYCTLKKNPVTKTDIKANLRYLLLSLFLNMHAKRADLGSVYIYQQPPPLDKADHGNYIVMSQKIIVLNTYKTASKRGAIKEPLNAILMQDIQESLRLFPRDYLIVSTRGEPYSNDSYGKFVKRQCLLLFGKSMGVSIWRIVQIGADVDFNYTSIQDLERGAHFRGHSLAQEMLAYRKKPDSEGSSGINAFVQKRPKHEQGEPVVC